MAELLHQLIEQSAMKTPDVAALWHKDACLSYRELQEKISAISAGLAAAGLARGERVGIYLPKQPETVFAMFGANRAGGAFVPINPLLKAPQVAYILRDCNIRILITSSQRLEILEDILAGCHDLRVIVTVDEQPPGTAPTCPQKVLRWGQLLNNPVLNEQPVTIDGDMAAILYTSGSTGNPKGVVLSHRNMVTGARSVAEYLGNIPGDRILAVLPFSFDYGLSQMTTAFLTGASVVLMDYLFPGDILKAIVRYRITGLAAVPPLWNQLAQLTWPPEAGKSLRYITNSGGAMPKAISGKLREQLPDTDIFLMYGLTEAFRSTYLPPDQIEIRPESIGKAIPNAEILVVREDGSECAPGEPGELVHRGALVAMGYWNDPDKTAERFKPCPGRPTELPLTEIAVWSGDQVRKDDEGYLYFISRKDEMIKTSGYRVSPTEVEEVVYGLEGVAELAAVGLPHQDLGQAILLVAAANPAITEEAVLNHCRQTLPNYMVPLAVRFIETLPRNQNGKIDRKLLANTYRDVFQY
ncbi:MAG: acyl-CoA ligase (AMP-forming), exosortase A system-associated [Porticoccaceae bacterium]|nr:acyl-CoA ligase (AMP-forming), exosortase A system-associated [Porticoccaceae bacterium]